MTELYEALRWAHVKLSPPVCRRILRSIKRRESKRARWWEALEGAIVIDMILRESARYDADRVARLYVLARRSAYDLKRAHERVWSKEHRGRTVTAIARDVQIACMGRAYDALAERHVRISGGLVARLDTCKAGVDGAGPNKHLTPTGVAANTQFLPPPALAALVRTQVAAACGIDASVPVKILIMDTDAGASGQV